MAGQKIVRDEKIVAQRARAPDSIKRPNLDFDKAEIVVLFQI